MFPYIEVSLSWLLMKSRGHDAKAFYTSPAFASHAEPTITVTSPDCGASPATLGPEYIADGGDRIPALSWAAPADLEPEVREWLLVVEDMDAPLPMPICHGIYGGIAPETRRVAPEDFEVEDEKRSLVKGGFHWGKGMRDALYLPPRPLMNHGIHRYVFQVVALSEALDKKMLEGRATKGHFTEAIKGKVLGWGMWVGSCERKWT
ncbi:phosphatidylethanolamine-binding protein [Colletotrichum cereale]|nr:phosphatidylethanolamine-binding protein [Colletotrichum cereale]